MAWPLSSPTELLQVHFPYILKYLAAACSPSSSQADNELSPTDRYSKISQFSQLYLQVRIALQNQVPRDAIYIFAPVSLHPCKR